MKVFLIFCTWAAGALWTPERSARSFYSANAFITRILFVPSAVARVVLVRPKLPSPSPHSVAGLTVIDSAVCWVVMGSAGRHQLLSPFA